jgi:ribosomal protein S18 acetylase RimI-like enzyme
MDSSKNAHIVIRPADHRDSFEARQVQWAVGWKDAPEQHRWWPAPDPDWAESHYFKEIVAEVDGVIAGRIGLEAYVPPFAELVNLCVRPDYRRLGLGEQLTQAGQREAARLGFSALFLQTEIDNTGAHRLYSAEGWVPTAHGKMLRMVKLIDYPLLVAFKRLHPLNQYQCRPISGAGKSQVWNMEWHAYVTEDYLRLRLESGASQSDSDGKAPVISGCEWSIGEGERTLCFTLSSADMLDIEPGNFVELTLTAENRGRRAERGVFQAVLPPGVRISDPSYNTLRTFGWDLNPGESHQLQFTVQIEKSFDASTLWYLNYSSLPVSVEAYWHGHRALLSTALQMAAPPPA